MEAILPVVERRSFKSSWGIHGLALAVLAVLAIGLTLLTWFHPTLGYAEKGSVIAGADLRSDLIKILWTCYAVLAAVSTLVLTIASRFTTQRLAPMLGAYALGLASLFPAMMILDHFI